MPGGGKPSRPSLSSGKDLLPEIAPALLHESAVQPGTRPGVSINTRTARRITRRLTMEVLAAITLLIQADITAVLIMVVLTAVGIVADTIKKAL